MKYLIIAALIVTGCLTDDDDKDTSNKIPVGTYKSLATCDGVLTETTLKLESTTYTLNVSVAGVLMFTGSGTWTQPDGQICLNDNDPDTDDCGTVKEVTATGFMSSVDDPETVASCGDTWDTWVKQ